MNRRSLIKSFGILPFSSLLVWNSKAETNEQKVNRKASEPFNVTDYIKSDMQLEFTFKNFYVSNNSEQAFFAAYDVCSVLGNKNNNPYTMVGQSGNGKTHLLHAIVNEIKTQCHHIKVQMITGEEFIEDAIKALRRQHLDQFIDLYMNIDVLIVDDIYHLERGQVTQEIFERILRDRIKNNKQVILTSNRSIRKNKLLNVRLASLVLGGPVTTIKNPSKQHLEWFLEQKADEYDVANPKLLAQRNKSRVQSYRECLGLIKSESLVSKAT